MPRYKDALFNHEKESNRGLITCVNVTTVFSIWFWNPHDRPYNGAAAVVKGGWQQAVTATMNEKMGSDRMAE